MHDKSRRISPVEEQLLIGTPSESDCPLTEAPPTDADRDFAHLHIDVSSASPTRLCVTVTEDLTGES